MTWPPRIFVFIELVGWGMCTGCGKKSIQCFIVHNLSVILMTVNMIFAQI